jgi:hypothetical protein
MPHGKWQADEGGQEAMAKVKLRRRTAPKRTLIGPLVMLASGAAVGVMMWRFLMLEPSPGARWRVSEQLSAGDREALARVLSAHP